MNDSDIDEEQKKEQQDYSISKHLLQREKELHQKNNTLQLKNVKLIKQKGGNDILKMPLSKLKFVDPDAISRAAEDEYGPSTRVRSSTESKGQHSLHSRRASTTMSTKKNLSRPLTAKSTSNVKRQIKSNNHDLTTIESYSNDVVDDDEKDISQPALNRILKAKLKVLQLDFDKLLKFHEQREDVFRKNEEIFKGSEEERVKNSKNFQVVSSQAEKLKLQNEELKVKNENLENMLSSVKKDLDTSIKHHKQFEQEFSQKDLKLNRALEEIERIKKMSVKSDQNAKEKFETVKKNLDTMHLELKRSEKLRGELVNGFKKQQQLIEVLKKQKMHIEAAKLLEFTEEEFIKALNITI